MATSTPTLFERSQALLDAFLFQQKMRKTIERYKILECVVQQTKPFDAQTIFQEMKNGSFAVSSATVFSALDVFAQAGILVRLPITSSMHYIMTEKCQEYSLLWCRICGKITLYRQRKLLSSLKKSKPPRFKNDHPIVFFYGVCAVCRNAQNRHKI